MHLATTFTLLTVFLGGTSICLAFDENAEVHDDYEDISLEGRFDNLSLREPSLYFNYGAASFNAEDLSIQPADVGMAELQMGYTRSGYLKKSPNIAFQYYDGFAVSYLSSQLGQNTANSALDLESWRFGPASRQGLGYKLAEDQDLIFFNGTSMTWSNVNLVSTPFDAPLNSLDRASEIRVYTEDMHFGTRFEGGVRAEVLPSVSIEARYERSIVFRRHMFWKWAGSAALEYISQDAIDRFVESILDSRAEWAPVISFVLKNSLSYAWYEMRQDAMNWPFDGEAPLSTDGYKLGLVLNL